MLNLLRGPGLRGAPRQKPAVLVGDADDSVPSVQLEDSLFVCACAEH